LASAQSPTLSLVTPTVRAPRVEFQIFESKAAQSKVSYHLYTPEVYDTTKGRRFPVLYWLHGSGGGLAGIAAVSAIFDRAIREGKIAPMLVVFPNGLASSMWCDSKDGAMPIETIVIKELLPHIDAAYRTMATREGRLIEGFSMGGFGAARLGFKYPQLFGAVSILAGGPLDLDFAGPRATGNPAERERIFKDTFGSDLDYYRSQHPITVAEQQADAIRGNVRVRIVVGSRDDTGPLNRAYSAQPDLAHVLSNQTPSITLQSWNLANVVVVKSLGRIYSKDFGPSRNRGWIIRRVIFTSSDILS